MVFAKANVKKMGRPPKNMQKDHRQESESVIRTGGRVKKAKKVFDPSENNPPKKRTRTQIQNNSDTERSKINYSSENTNDGGGGASLQQSKTNQKRKKNGVLSYYKRRKLAQKSQEDFCTICTKKSNNLIHCQDCNLNVHKFCIKPNFQNTKVLEAKWRCDSCKSCAICYENAETGPLITCASCVDCYHYNCHIPNMSSNEQSNNINWLCTKCLPKPQFKPAILKSRRMTICTRRMTISDMLSKNDSPPQTEKNINILNNNNNDTVKVKINLNNEINSDNDDTDEEENVDDNDDNDDDDDDDDDVDYVYDGKDENTVNKNNSITYDKINVEKKKIVTLIPNVSKWSCDKLANYVKEYFPVESKILREQEIDGASLLLLARTDVINGLKLKLGPAIRLYNFITILQTKKNDITGTWIY